MKKEAFFVTKGANEISISAEGSSPSVEAQFVVTGTPITPALKE